MLCACIEEDDENMIKFKFQNTYINTEQINKQTKKQTDL